MRLDYKISKILLSSDILVLYHNFQLNVQKNWDNDVHYKNKYDFRTQFMTKHPKNLKDLSFEQLHNSPDGQFL